MKTLHELNEAVLNGELNALDAYVQLKRAEALLKEVMSGIKGQAIEEAAKYGEKSFRAFDATIEMKSGGGRWDYKKLSWWGEFVAKQEAAKKAYKSKQVHLTISDDDGEVIEPADYKPNADTIAVKL